MWVILSSQNYSRTIFENVLRLHSSLFQDLCSTKSYSRMLQNGYIILYQVLYFIFIEYRKFRSVFAGTFHRAQTLKVGRVVTFIYSTIEKKRLHCTFLVRLSKRKKILWFLTLFPVLKDGLSKKMHCILSFFGFYSSDLQIIVHYLVEKSGKK